MEKQSETLMCQNDYSATSLKCSNAPKQAWRRQEKKLRFYLIAGSTNIDPSSQNLQERILKFAVCLVQETTTLKTFIYH